MDPQFQILRHAVEIIAQHRDYPGKQDLVKDGLDDIDDHYRRGRLTVEEKERLRSILLSGTDRLRLPEELCSGTCR